MLTQHLAKEGGFAPKAAGLKGRSGRIVMTNEARVLRELRMQTGLSMRQAGVILGCTDSYISHIENGRADVPTGVRLDRFLAAYGGIKQKSFYERVRRFRETFGARQELIEIAMSLNEDKIAVILQILKTII